MGCYQGGAPLRAFEGFLGLGFRDEAARFQGLEQLRGFRLVGFGVLALGLKTLGVL